MNDARAGTDGAGRVQPAEAGSLAGRIGLRLRARRKELHLTLAETAERSGLSTSYLSAVENGTNLPSLQALVRIADALETTIPTVLVEEGANRVRQGRLPGSAPGRADLAHEQLQLKAVAIRSAVGEQAVLALPTREHDVFCYVISGTLEVLLNDRESVVLGEGEALDVRSASSISFFSPTDALALWTSCPVRA